MEGVSRRRRSTQGRLLRDVLHGRHPLFPKLPADEDALGRVGAERGDHAVDQRHFREARISAF